MNCYKLIIAYDGTHYSGWQIQPNGLSIQESIQKAIKIILNDEVVVVGSGRTDAGVHALNQVAHFKTFHELEDRRFLLSLNALLPKDIRVKSIGKVHADFHAQYDAIGKEYHYHLHLERISDPFRYLYSWQVMKKLNLTLLEEGTKQFLGTHDFTSFANERHIGPIPFNPIRTIYRLDIKPTEGGLRLEFEGNGFLYKMVRNIVGTLVDVASERLTLKDVQNVFEAKDRRKASMAAPPQGLFLVKVNYPQLP